MDIFQLVDGGGGEWATRHPTTRGHSAIPPSKSVCCRAVPCVVRNLISDQGLVIMNYVRTLIYPQHQQLAGRKNPSNAARVHFPEQIKEKFIDFHLALGRGRDGSDSTSSRIPGTVTPVMRLHNTESPGPEALKARTRTQNPWITTAINPSKTVYLSFPRNLLLSSPSRGTTASTKLWWGDVTLGDLWLYYCGLLYEDGA